MPAKLDRLIKLLDSLPDDEVLLVPDVMSMLGMSRRETVCGWARENVRLSFYSYIVPSKHGLQYIFGNPRAIIATRKHLDSIGE